MKLLSVSLARLTVVTETAEINPRNKVSLPELTKAFVNRYGFLKYPTAVAEFDLTNGVTFATGKIDGINIGSLILYFGGVVIDTGSSTDDSERVLSDLVSFVQELVGIQYVPVAEPRKFYLTELAFHSTAKLETLNPILRHISNRISDIVSGPARQRFDFEPVTVRFLPDLQKTKWQVSAFSLDRLAGAPLDENKWFSSAPLPTQEHLKLLDEIETMLVSQPH